MGFLDRLVARDHRMAAAKREAAEGRGGTYESASEKAASREAENSRQRARGHRRSLAKQDAKERRNDSRRW